MREQVELDTGWSFRFGERGDWQRIRLPHSWNARDGQDGGDDYRRGSGWYRRELPLSAESAGRRAFLEFDGANTTTDVWLNGVHLGQHSGGYTRFRFDVTEVLRPGANDLLVRVDNGENPDGRHFRRTSRSSAGCTEVFACS
ncbi:MAG: beta galactosidase jelly roll domain-containing protein [Saccharopolyspora sp.]|uniref:sugar-binding domain-containing protein n=1 Tax=Saccharopolyspora sp. TaxID=33915 RepID=UPI0025EE4285|nr:sugar-binding domain-containing protein [Saccharopolyspora sp.]MBQ6641739.1 beta galactosidase jelly roll domain-containing protein [Saccharopolyspora sp.]